MSEDRENSLPADRQAVWLYFIHKVFPKRQPASERPVLFAEGGKPVDNPAFDERAKGRAPFYTHEMPQAEHQTAHYDADKAAGTVSGGFEFADIHMEMGSIPPYRLYIGFCAVLRISILYAVIWIMAAKMCREENAMKIISMRLGQYSNCVCLRRTEIVYIQ